MYVVRFSDTAMKDLVALQKSAPNAVKKLTKLIDELKEHPRTGTGQVEQLKGYTIETWSRRLNKEHRLVYEIHEENILVLVISSFGHYK